MLHFLRVTSKIARMASLDFFAIFEKTIIKSSLSEVLCKNGALKNFANFTGKHLSRSLIFSKVAGLRPAFLLKKRLQHRCLQIL